MAEYSSEYHLDKKRKEGIVLSPIVSPERRLRSILRGHLSKEINGVLFYSKFVFPFIRKEKNGEILGEDSVSNLKVLNSGGYGIALKCENILMKVFKYENEQKCIVKELKNIYQVYYDNDKRVKIPRQINAFIGVITNEQGLMSSVKQLKNKVSDEFSVYTSMYENRFSKREMTSSISKTSVPESVTKRYKEYEKTEITAIILECEEYESIDYVKKFVNKRNINTFLFDFINDMYAALVFLHNERHIIHNDIKYENIVASFDQKLGRYVFKLIDFGLSRKVSSLEEVFQHKRPTGTPLLFKGTIFAHHRSFLYDWHCLFITIFDLCLLTKSDIALDQKKDCPESNEDYSIGTSSDEDVLFLPEQTGGWVRATLMTDDRVCEYMDFIHNRYLPSVDKSLIAFIKSIMKFQFYLGDEGNYLIDIDELIHELYPSK